MIKKNDVDVEKIVIKYADGTEKEITKGAVINMTPNEETDEVTMNFEFVDFKGTDLTNMVYGVVEMGTRMGMFDGSEDEA
jgi:hypothetical protein